MHNYVCVAGMIRKETRNKEAQLNIISRDELDFAGVDQDNLGSSESLGPREKRVASYLLEKHVRFSSSITWQMRTISVTDTIRARDVTRNSTAGNRRISDELRYSCYGESINVCGRPQYMVFYE